MLSKITATSPLRSVPLDDIKFNLNNYLASKGLGPLADHEWSGVLTGSHPPTPKTPIKKEPSDDVTPTGSPVVREVFTPKNWRAARYGPKMVPGSTFKDRAYEFLKRMVEDSLDVDSEEYALLKEHQADLKAQLKEDITTAEKDGDHEFLERHFIIDIVERDVKLARREAEYKRKKGWLEIQRTLRSKTQSILFKGIGENRNRLNGGHCYAMFTSDGGNLLGKSPTHASRNDEFHKALDDAFLNSTTRKGFIRRARNIALRFIHPGDQALTKIAPKNLLFGKTLFTDDDAHLLAAKKKLEEGHAAREKMFEGWEAALESGSESEGGLDDVEDAKL